MCPNRLEFRTGSTERASQPAHTIQLSRARVTRACGLEQAAYPLTVGFRGYSRELWNSRILAKLYNHYVRHQACADMSGPALLTLVVLQVTETEALEGRRGRLWIQRH